MFAVLLIISFILFHVISKLLTQLDVMKKGVHNILSWMLIRNHTCTLLSDDEQSVRTSILHQAPSSSSSGDTGYFIPVTITSLKASVLSDKLQYVMLL